MKKQTLHFAVLVSGIDEEYQNTVLQGIHSFAEKHCIDISHFIAYGGILGNPKHDIGEYNIFRLVNLHLFDGVILLTNTISSPETVQRILDQVRAANIPAVSIDRDFGDCYSIVIDNRRAMEDMTRHFICEHGARRINYISGPDDNPESVMRLNGYKKVLDEYHIPIEEERIYHGSFRGKDGRDAVEAFLRSDLEFPEAIICANDAMALSALITLDEHGYRVPQDVLVSGFDNTYNAQNYAPALTSVERPLVQSGELACDLLLSHLDGKPKARVHTLTMEQRYTESCGCHIPLTEDIVRFKKHNYQLLEGNNTDICLINRMSCSLVECDTFEGYIDALKAFILETGCLEFYLCLCENWHQKINSSEVYVGGGSINDSIIEGYSTEMTVPLCYYNGKFHYHDSFRSTMLLPERSHTLDHTRSLFYVPLHFHERCLGYFVIGNTPFPLRSLLFHTWSINISNSLENIRKIICLDSIVQELDKLYAIDPLAGIYNRNGFKRETEQLFQKCMEENRSVMVMFIDMDGLKGINDTYGHKAGDIAIHCTAEIVQECCKPGEICCRFGGDEFIIFTTDATDEDARSLMERINRSMAHFNETSNRPFSLNVSIGYHITIPVNRVNLFQMITIADNEMYLEKRKKRQSKYLKSGLNPDSRT